MKRLHSFSRFMLVVIGFLFFSVNPSFAQFTEFLPAWTHTASSCAVDEDSLVKYQVNAANFTFESTEISDPGLFGPIPIIARCNVLNPLDAGNPVWDALVVGYRDPDGTGTAHRATARLFRVSRPTGNVFQVAAFNSNTNAVNITTRTEGLVQFNHTFDFLNNEYFVQIELVRTSTSLNPQAFSVRLTDADEVP